MPVRSYKMGDGVLTLGAASLDISMQVTSCTVAATENVTTAEEVPTLGGGVLPEEEDVRYTWALAANVIQDISAAGLTAWSYANAGVFVPFLYVPSNVEDRAVRGFVRPIPVTIGGEVVRAGRPRADFSWKVQADPVFGDYDPITDLIEETI